RLPARRAQVLPQRATQARPALQPLRLHAPALRRRNRPLQRRHRHPHRTRTRLTMSRLNLKRVALASRQCLFLLFAVAFACQASSALAADDQAFASQLKPFLNTYCIACHGEQKQKGDRRFDQLTVDITDDASLVDMQDIVDQLNLAEMPPKGAKKPSDSERQAAVAWLTGRIQKHHEARRSSGG